MNQSEKVLLNSRLINQVKEANNFDFIRFFLAYSVMFNHFSTLTETDPFWFVSGGFRVKGFFIISGFLVMFSFLRTPNTRIFFRKRIQRIMPAYSLTILLCALIGLFLTSLSCREYLTSSSLYTYLICNLLTFNFLSPDLPGVFDTNPLQAMNGSLWPECTVIPKKSLHLNGCRVIAVWLEKQCQIRKGSAITKYLCSGESGLWWD